MFIYNIKMNGSVLFKIVLSIIICIVIILCGVIGFRIYQESRQIDPTQTREVHVLTNKNYASVLDTVHNQIDTYVGQKIKFSGFVYRVYDLDREQFVLGRNMIISSDFQTVVIGFLCHYKDAISFADSTWVELEGTITKGDYHGDMPILEVTSIKKIDKPNDEYVYPPDENFIPTSAIL
ncbi:MAG: hypothetical protein ACLTEH_03570 [Clostridia bacterium]